MPNRTPSALSISTEACQKVGTHDHKENPRVILPLLVNR